MTDQHNTSNILFSPFTGRLPPPDGVQESERGGQLVGGGRIFKADDGKVCGGRQTGADRLQQEEDETAGAQEGREKVRDCLIYYKLNCNTKLNEIS